MKRRLRRYLLRDRERRGLLLDYDRDFGYVPVIGSVIDGDCQICYVSGREVAIA